MHVLNSYRVYAFSKNETKIIFVDTINIIPEDLKSARKNTEGECCRILKSDRPVFENFYHELSEQKSR